MVRGECRHQSSCSSRSRLTSSLVTAPPREAKGRNPRNSAGRVELPSARRANSEITSPVLLPSRRPISVAAKSTSSAMLSVVLIHRMIPALAGRGISQDSLKRTRLPGVVYYQPCRQIAALATPTGRLLRSPQRIHPSRLLRTCVLTRAGGRCSRPGQPIWKSIGDCGRSWTIPRRMCIQGCAGSYSPRAWPP